MDNLEISIKTYKGAFALIDILGYGEKMLKSSIEDIKKSVIDKIISIIETANFFVNHDRNRFSKFSNNNTIHTTPINYLFFSDTMLIFIETDDESTINTPEYSLNSLCYASSIILGNAFENNIALRGAISLGEVFIQRDPVIIIGKPISDLANLEKSQNWAGIILSQKIESMNLIDPFVVKYNVPFKNSKDSKEMYTINWVKYNSKPNFELCFDSDRSDVVEKKINTIKFYDYAINNLKSNQEL